MESKLIDETVSLNEEFTNVLSQLNGLKSYCASIINQVKALEKSVKKQMKKYDREIKKQKSKKCIVIVIDFQTFFFLAFTSV